jgi:RimJ/RimL family protein N-acetyltransferase
LLLRRWRPEDLVPFADLNADPEVMRHIRDPLRRSESDAFAARIEQHLDAEDFGLWAVEVRETGAFVGFTGPGATDVRGAVQPLGRGGLAHVPEGHRLRAAVLHRLPRERWQARD